MVYLEDQTTEALSSPPSAAIGLSLGADGGGVGSPS